MSTSPNSPLVDIVDGVGYGVVVVVVQMRTHRGFRSTIKQAVEIYTTKKNANILIGRMLEKVANTLSLRQGEDSYKINNIDACGTR